MTSRTTHLNSAAGPAAHPFSTDSVVSSDGTTIGYRQLGRGPGLVLLHGTMESAASHMELAEALSDAFTVYLPDRRGRGLSGPHGKDYRLASEVEDVAVLLARTGAHDVFGVSSGAIVWLQAALSLPTIRRAVIFEPPLLIDGSISTAFLARYEAEIAAGDTAAALITAMKGAQMGPAAFDLVPRWLLERMTGLMLRSEDRKAAAGDVTMRMLAPTIHNDFQLVVETQDAVDRFSGVKARVLLLGGSKSPAYLKRALDALEAVLPDATRHELPGLDHGASGNAKQRGRPDVVAAELRRFLA
jgi:pimeloyl-ACP methyl ester carboxylesterase